MGLGKVCLKAGGIVVGLIGFTSSLVGIITSWDDLKTIWATREKLLATAGSLLSTIFTAAVHSPSVRWSSVCLTILAVVALSLHINMLNRGGKGGPISLCTFLRRINLSRYFACICKFHELEHYLHWEVAQIRNTPELVRDLNARNPRMIIGGLLARFKEIIRSITGADVAVHAKLFQRKDDDATVGQVLLSDALLFAYERVPADHEFLRNESGDLPRRRNTELFSIDPSEEGQARRLAERAETGQLNGGHKVCSAYNYVFRRNEHYWICNDLEKARKRRRFFSTSENYTTYYRSLAVFVIAHPIPPGDPVERRSTRGLLVVDSAETGVFERDLCRQLVGYLAHRLYGLLLEIESARERLPANQG
jgi:hypothetical protein